MTRSILSGLLGLLSVAAVGAVPLACQSGGVGDPCVPEDEYDPQFPGFKVTEENIESRSFQCETRICLVNHFQGRVSCPAGQATPKSCTPPAGPECGADEKCIAAGAFAPDCDPAASPSTCPNGLVCDPKGHFCACTGGCPDQGGAPAFCDAITKTCTSYVCHKTGDCQSPGAPDNKGKPCCVPGTDTPVAQQVCGQCNSESHRDAEGAVYCSCRCGVAEGEPDDPNFNFCSCPTGFECKEIRKNVGLGDKQITGKYCIKSGSQFVDAQRCTSVDGFSGVEPCLGFPKP